VRAGRAWAAGIALAVLALSAAPAPAARPPLDPRGPCDSPDKRPWRTLAAPPPDADALLALAAANPSFSVPQRWMAETWFGLGDAVLLCRSDAPLPRACAGEWWRFEAAPGGGHALAEHDGFLCLAAR
jgi:hypothetical protein